jgi:hypothetical protein
MNGEQFDYEIKKWTEISEGSAAPEALAPSFSSLLQYGLLRALMPFSIRRIADRKELDMARIV